MAQKIIKEADVNARIERISRRMISEGRQQANIDRNNGRKNINFGSLNHQAKAHIQDKVINQIILESNPHIARAIEILTGLILCPNGGSVVTLNFEADVGASANEALKKNASSVCSVLENHFTKAVKLQNQLSDMVYKTLATDGSYVTAFIPDSSISTLFNNVGLEAEIERLDATFKPAIEHALIKDAVTISHDISVLLRPDRARYKGLVGLEAESKTGLSAARVMSKRRHFKNNPIVTLERGDRDNEVSSPIIRNIPSEAVRPIVFKGEADDPYSYIILLDEDGYPVQCDEEIDFDKDLRSMSEDTTENAQVKMIANNFTKMKSKQVNTVNGLFAEFNKLIESDIAAKLIDGTYAENYSLKDDDTISTIMFHRLLKKQKTRILVVPAHLINYFAFDINRFGVGESLISKTKALSNIYTVLFYANFLGNLSNTIPQKEVVIDFDSEDIDDGKTLEMVMNEVISSRVSSFDFNFNGPSGVIRNLQKYGVQVKMNNLETGDLPSMNVEVNDKKRDIRPIDPTFMQEVSRLISLRLGFSPDLIDNSYSPEFSSQVVRDNDITARQISKYISKLSDNVTDYVIKATLNDPRLIEACLEVITGENKLDTLEAILAVLSASTPTTDSSSISEKMEVINENIGVIELIVETLFPDSLADGIDNMSAGHIDSLRGMAKSYFMQDYIRRNSSFKGIVDKIRNIEGFRDIINGESEFKTEIMEILAEHAEKVMIKDKEMEKELAAAENGGEEEVETPTPTSTPTPEEATPTQEGDGDADIPTIDVPGMI